MRLLARLRRMADRPPDEIIGNPAFLHRWDLVPRNRWRSVYLHEIFGSDNQMVLHDHPWPSLSFILAGAYVEHRIRAGGIHERRLVEAGDIVFRLLGSPHRLEMPEGENMPCWTLFLAGPRVREWGFHCRDRWIPWTELEKHSADAVANFAEPDEVTDEMAEAAGRVLAKVLLLAWQGIHTGRAHPYPAWKVGGHHNAGQGDYIDLARHMVEAALSARPAPGSRSAKNSILSAPQPSATDGTDAP